MVTRLILIVALPLLAACTGGGRVERVSDFQALYHETTFAPDVVGAVPLPRDRVGKAPVVVNWFYAGTTGGTHRVVLRTATWDAAGEPVTDQRQFAVPSEQLLIAEPFALTREVARWVPLHEAAAGLSPPAGLDTWRQRVDPKEVDPVEVDPDPEILPPDIPGLPELPE